MTDIHCHILPNVDDGPKDWATTLQMCNLALADGTRHIVATPHANHKYDYSRQRHSDLLDELGAKVPELSFTLGCDFNLSQENIADATRHPDRYSIGKSCYILVEFNDFQTPRQMVESLLSLHSAGLITIVSHPERNTVIDQYPDLPRQFVDLGAAIQITAGSLSGEWGKKAKKCSETLLSHGLVAVIASDAHDVLSRKPTLSAARKAAAKMVGEDSANLLVFNNPSFIVSEQAATEALSEGEARSSSSSE